MFQRQYSILAFLPDFFKTRLVPQRFISCWAFAFGSASVVKRHFSLQFKLHLLNLCNVGHNSKIYINIWVQRQNTSVHAMMSECASVSIRPCVFTLYYGVALFQMYTCVRQWAGLQSVCFVSCITRLFLPVNPFCHKSSCGCQALFTRKAILWNAPDQQGSQPMFISNVVEFLELWP